MTNMKTRDKHGREILPGDVLKVYHFTAALRREKHYMYKHVLGYYEGVGPEGKDKLLDISHMSYHPDSEGYEGYYLGLELGVLGDYEIVQGEGLDERERVTSND